MKTLKRSYIDLSLYTFQNKWKHFLPNKAKKIISVHCTDLILPQSSKGSKISKSYHLPAILEHLCQNKFQLEMFWRYGCCLKATGNAFEKEGKFVKIPMNFPFLEEKCGRIFAYNVRGLSFIFMGHSRSIVTTCLKLSWCHILIVVNTMFIKYSARVNQKRENFQLQFNQPESTTKSIDLSENLR